MSVEDWPLFSMTSTVSEVEAGGGMVVGPDQLIAEAGASVLRAGGNAVDAAVAAAWATDVVEPGSAGLGGSATITIALRDPDRVAVVEGHMVSPKRVHADQYPLADADTKQQYIERVFGMAPVKDNLNLYGPTAVTVPGTAACLLTAQERYGVLPRKEVLAPAIALAANGFHVNPITAAYIAAIAPRMSKEPGMTEIYMPHGFPAAGPILGHPGKVVQPALARTLEILAEQGQDAFYRGEIGRSIVKRIQFGGGALDIEDLESYEADVFDPPLQARYGPYTVIGAPHAGMSTALAALYIHEAARGGGGAADDVVAWAYALCLAFIDRAKYMTHDPEYTPPWDALSSRAYALARLEAERSGGDPPDPASFSAHETVAPLAGPAVHGADRHTSQITAVDRDGNIASCTGTLMNAFGSQVLDQETGIVLNGGMAYFDPAPGRVNSLKGGVKVLSAMTPLVLADDERGPVVGIGASGGRRIISVVARIVGALRHGEKSLQRAIELPLIHAESKTVFLDPRWDREAAEALDAVGFTVVPTPETHATGNYARPYGVLIGRDGKRRSGVDPKKPAGIAIA